MSTEPQPLVALRALEHHTYCERQCALIHGDKVWFDNEHTTKGLRAHRRVDSGESSDRRGHRVLRSIPLWSERLGLTGRADVVEVHDDGTVIPVEYKAGRRHGLAGDLQLCAQALCLEEMLGLRVSFGFLWLGGPRRRSRVEFNDELRALTEEAVLGIRANLNSSQLPPAPNDSRCIECQLLHYCLPDVVAAESAALVVQTDRELYRCDT